MAEHAPPRPPDNARQGRPGAETGAQRRERRPSATAPGRAPESALAPRRDPESPDNARRSRPGAKKGARRNPEPQSPDAPARSEPSEPSPRRVLGRVLLVQLVALALLWALQAAYHR